MRPWYQSKRLWAAVATALLNVLVVLIGMCVQREELATVLVASLSAVGAALVVALGLGDQGKEAAAMRLEAIRLNRK